MRIATVLFGCIFIAPIVSAQDSPYSGMEHRKVKALSQEQVDQFLAGEGMGFALAAELNGYPGPRHVLDNADKLGLEADQGRSIQEIFDGMSAEAKRLGKQYVGLEEKLEDHFASGKVSDASLKETVLELGRIRALLRYTHLRAHLRTKYLLTEKQLQAYRAVRGYGGEHQNEHMQMHHE